MYDKYSKVVRCLKTIILLCLFQACIIPVFAQTITIEGKVFDAETSAPLSSATVSIQNTMQGDITDFDGSFVFTIPKTLLDSVLECSYVGYESVIVPVKDISSPLNISLNPKIYQLSEVEINPWEAWDYVAAALNNRNRNLPMSSYMTTGYYREYIAENSEFLKYTEAIISSHNTSYLDSIESHSKVLQARTINNLSQLEFMRKKIEKKYQKELKKAEKEEGEELPKDIDHVIQSISFGGPDMILNSGALRKGKTYFLDEPTKKHFNYTIEGFTEHHGRKVIIIQAKGKKKFDDIKISNVKIYITLDKYAIVFVQVKGKIVIPTMANAMLFLFGISIEDPVFDIKVSYIPINNIWYLKHMSSNVGMNATKIKIFSKNEISNFSIEQLLNITDFDLQNVVPIPSEEQIDKGKPLEQQVENNEKFWESYHIKSHQ